MYVAGALEKAGSTHPLARHGHLADPLRSDDSRLKDINLGSSATLPGAVRELRTRVVRLIGAGAAREALTLKPREIKVVILQVVVVSTSALGTCQNSLGREEGLTLSPYSGPNFGRPVVGSV